MVVSLPAPSLSGRLPCGWLRLGPHPFSSVQPRTPFQHVAPLLTATSSAQPETAGSTSDDWSKRLLGITKKSRKQKQQTKRSSDDIFYPGERSMSFGDLSAGAEGDSDEPASSSKRLPAEMRCFDTARIYVKSGDGGNGCVAFRREAHMEHGGPSGGDGGRGGNVWAVVDPSMNSLSSFRGRIHWRAANGINGQGSDCNGADADDMYIPVPPGTIIRRKDAAEDDPPLAELLQAGDKALLLTGGRGGRGNLSFKSARNRAPTIAERGEPGTETWLDLELKVVADIGIIGVPNAGKSTLLSVVTAAKPKIANYPFTTLVPNLGVCEMDYQTTVFADVPGLLEGAHEGLGLGHEFLRHVQRCRALVHVVDGTSPDPVGDFRAINLELELFNPALKDKPQLVAYNKVDMPDSGDYWEFVKEELIAEGVPEEHAFPISAATGQGVLNLVRKARSLLDQMGPATVDYETDAVNQVVVPKSKSAPLDHFEITMENDGYRKTFFVEGQAIQRFAQMTNWDYYEAVKRFQKVLDATGINSALRAQGIEEGDSVVIGEMEFDWKDDTSEGALYDDWRDVLRSKGKARQGAARWPHADIKR